MHALQRGVDGVAILGRVVVAEAAARLHARGGDAVDHHAMLDDVIGLGERGFGRGLVAEQLHEADIVRATLPDPRRAGGASLRGRHDGGQRLVVGDDQLGRVERLVISLRHHEGDVVADPARPVLGQRRIRRPEDAAVAPLQSIGHRQVAPSRGLPVFSGEHGEHARRGLGLGGVDRANARMGVRRAQHVTEHHARQDHVADIAAASRDQPRILEPGYALTNGKFAHLNPRSGNTCEPRRYRKAAARWPWGVCVSALAAEPCSFDGAIPYPALSPFLPRSRVPPSSPALPEFAPWLSFPTSLNCNGSWPPRPSWPRRRSRHRARTPPTRARARRSCCWNPSPRIPMSRPPRNRSANALCRMAWR